LRVAVIGTSNALLAAGLSEGLARAPAVSELRNLSLGASLSLHAALLAAEVDLGAYDVCLLDFAVNETPFAVGGIPRAALRDYARAAAAQAIAQGCLPVVLVLPRRDGEERHRAVTRHHLQIARELNLPHLDVIALVARLVARLGIPRALLFRDDSHLARWFALALGHELAAALRRLLRQRTAFVEQPWSGKRFLPLPLPPLVPPARRLRRRTTLLAMDLAELRVGEPLRVPAPGPVHGVWYNGLGSAGILRCAGATEALMDLRAVESQDRRGFLGQAIAFRAPVAPVDGTVTLEAVPVGGVADRSRRGLHLTTPAKAALPDLGFVEVGGIFAEAPEPWHLARRPTPASHVDLATLLPMTGLHAAIGIALTHELTYRRRDASPPAEPSEAME
jgi:hypothetical protein